jgi:hypothetical protein
VNPPRNRKGESGNPPPNANASEFYPNHLPTSFKRSRREANRKNSKFECQEAGYNNLNNSLFAREQRQLPLWPSLLRGTVNEQDV